MTREGGRGCCCAAGATPSALRGKERRRRGDISTPLPTRAWLGQVRYAKPGSILRAGGQGNVSRGCAPILLRSPALFSAEDLRGGTRHGTKRAVPHFLVGRCEGTLDSALAQRLVGRAGPENRGMRDCVTPNSIQKPLAGGGKRRPRLPRFRTLTRRAAPVAPAEPLAKANTDPTIPANIPSSPNKEAGTTLRHAAQGSPAEDN